MNTIFRSVLISHVASQAVVVIQKQFLWEWNTENNCGPRPQGPMYPYPPATNGTYLTAGNCDVIEDGLYIFNYECETTCQTDNTNTVKLICDCLDRVGPVERTVPCQWQYENGNFCESSTETTYDWECDPRKEACAEGQYQPAAMPENQFGLFSWNTTYGNVTEMVQGGMPGYINHIYISPNMVQNMPDSSDGNNTSGHNSVDDAELAIQLAESEEKGRGLKSKMRELVKSFAREREQFEETVEEAKEDKKDLKKQIEIMQEMLRYKLKEEDVENESDTEGPASRTITVELQDTNSKKEMLNDPTLTESIEYEEEKLEILQFESIEETTSSRAQAVESPKINDPIAELYTQLMDDTDTEDPLKVHKQKIKTARGRVQRLKTSMPKSSRDE